jgi:molybdopterin-guanine dinucleotide biosynthesis protein MobB
MKAVAIIGASDTGKTRLAVALIEELNRRGLKGSVLKKAGHEIELDVKGKDSWRFIEAGARSTAVLTDDKLFLIKKKEPGDTLLETALNKFSDVDLLLVEGGKRENAFKKILRVKDGRDQNLLSPPDDLIAIVSDKPFSPSYPVFLSDEVHRLTDFLLAELEPVEPQIKLRVNGRIVPLNQFVQRLFGETIRGMLRALRKVPEHPEKIILEVREGEGHEKDEP